MAKKGKAGLYSEDVGVFLVVLRKYHSKTKRTFHFWLQLPGCVEDGGEIAIWIMGIKEGRSKVEAKLKECGLCGARYQITS